MTDKVPLNVYDQEDHAYDDFDHVEEVDTRGPFLAAIIGAGLAVISCLILIGLCSTMVHRDKNSITISHLVMAIIGLLIAAAGAFFVLRWKKFVEAGGKFNWLVYGIIFVLVCVMAGYFLASSVYYYMYRPFHFSKLTSYNTEKWKDSFIDTWDFKRGWVEDRRIIWWVAFFSFVAFIGFLILAIAMWIAASNKMPLAKMLLAVACFAGILLALFALHYLWRTHNMYKNYSGKDANKTYIWMLGLLFIIGIVFLLANLVINLLKKKGLYFLFAFLLIFFLVVFIVFLGLCLRSLRQQQFASIGGQANCGASLGAIHESSVTSFCSSGKYLPNSSSCTKNFLVKRWENTKANELRFLNPNCCQSLSSASLWPLYIVGCLGLLFLAAIMAAIIANFYLGDTKEYLSDFDKSLGIIELAMLGAAVLALIAFAFWFGFRPKDPLYAQNPYLPSANDKGVYTDEKFTPVDLNKVYNGKVPDSASYPVPQAPNTLDEFPTVNSQNSILSITSKNAAPATAGIQAAILATNGKLSDPSDPNLAGNANARTLFFDDKNSNSDFLLLSGKAEDISNYLTSLKVQPKGMTKDTEVFVQTKYITDLSTLNGGVEQNVTVPAAPVLSTSNPVFNGTGYTVETIAGDCHMTNSCVSTQKCDLNTSTTCKNAFGFKNNNGVVKVMIPFKVTKSDGSIANYDHQGKYIANYDYQGKTYVINNATWLAGKLNMKLANPLREDIDLNVTLTDNQNRYLKESKIINIPVGSPDELVTDQVVLMTPDGKNCDGAKDVNACWAAQTTGKTDVEIYLKEEDGGAAVSGANVELYGNDPSMSQNFISAAKTDDKGKVVFSNMAFDRYFVKYPGSTKYVPNSGKVALQKVVDGDLTLFLHKKDSTDAVLSEYFNQGDNQDLAINVKNYNNANTCTLDATNKYCAYMSYENDIEGADAGYERVKINKFTESYYLAYKKPSPTYSTTCNVSGNGDKKYYYNSNTTIRSLNKDFDWDTVRKTSTSNFESLYCFNGWGLNSKKNYRKMSASEPTAATLCPQFYPDGTTFSLDTLKRLNNQ